MTDSNTEKPVDCVGGAWSRQGRIKKDSPDHSEFAEFNRALVLAAKSSPIGTIVEASGKQFVLLGSRASRGARGSTAIIVVPIDSAGNITEKQRFFYDWSAENNGVTVEGFSFPSYAQWRAVRASIASMNFSPIPSGTGSNDEWNRACSRGEFLPLSDYPGWFDGED